MAGRNRVSIGNATRRALAGGEEVAHTCLGGRCQENSFCEAQEQSCDLARDEMNQIQLIEENAIAYYQDITRLLGGEYH